MKDEMKMLCYIKRSGKNSVIRCQVQTPVESEKLSQVFM